MVAAVCVPPGPASAQRALEASSVEIVPAVGSHVEIAGRHYAGAMRVEAHDDGLAVTETVDVDTYLLGIREVPFSWPREALRAQAVAARTYLAWTLDRGRSQNGRRYGYDICATTACQVYGGMDAVLVPSGRSWRDAVESTSDEILMLGGDPIQALYSSTSGGRTRAVEDVFPGSAPRPYLRAVESPGEDSPFVRWTYLLSQSEMQALLSQAGLLEGDLAGVHTERTADGGGPWTVVIEGSGGTTRIDTWSLRTDLNRAAAEVMPARLPVLRPDGSLRRYPQTVLSPTYTISPELRMTPGSGGPPGFERVYRVSGRGWGHLVGMSQYGADAMARGGADYTEIVSHFYGGLEPVPAGDLLPESITVGLELGADEVVVVPTGPVTVLVDGATVAESVLGSWHLGRADGGAISAQPPVGLGRAPAVRGPRIVADPGGRPRAVIADVTAPAEVRLRIARDGRILYDSGFELHDAGEVTWAPAVLRSGRIGRLSLVVEARSPRGGDAAGLVLVPRAE